METDNIAKLNPMEKEPEIFTPFKLNPMYHIGNHGTVLSKYSCPRYRQKFDLGSPLKGNLNNGYIQYFLKLDNSTYRGNEKWFYAHRLVGDHFIANPQNLPEINHNDRIKANNYHKNLNWCTHAENIKHSFLTRVTKSGKDHPRFGVKLTEAHKDLLSKKKKGINHPKFTGWFVCNEIRYTSATSAAKALKTSSKTLKKWAMANINNCRFEGKGGPAKIEVVDEKMGMGANGVVYTNILGSRIETQIPPALIDPSPAPSFKGFL